MRLFTALSVDDEIKRRIGAFVEELSGGVQGVRWVDIRNMHATLVFLGEHPEKMLPGIKYALEESVSGIKSFEIGVKGMGVFPEKGRPRVIWLGLDEPTGEVLRLHKNLRKSLERRKINYDKKDFKPHLTVGRVKDISPEMKDILTRRAAGSEKKELGRFKADSVKLYSSVLSSAGPIHTVQKEQKFEY